MYLKKKKLHVYITDDLKWNNAWKIQNHFIEISESQGTVSFENACVGTKLEI